MSPIVPPADLTIPTLSVGDGKSPTKIRDAAQQFEALLIGQLLRSAHENGGWLGTSDPSSDCATEYAEQQFATVISQNGGLGLSDLICQGLGPKGGAK
jgi:Rod binding domain-containing protein